MPVDPQIRQLLDFMDAIGAPPLHEGTPQAARDGFRAMTVGMRQPEQVVPVASTEDLAVPGPAGPMRARIYRPERSGAVPTLVFLHGGGFVIGDLDTHDNQARALCRAIEAVVLSVEYRLAPEHPWPAAVDDSVAAVRWAADSIERLGGDPRRLVVGGDSAGGNLAAVTALVLRDTDGPALAAQLLIYPAVDLRGGADAYPSRLDNATGYFLTEDDMHWFGAQYVPAGADPSDPRLSPLLAASLRGLPPAVVATAEFDPLRDEGAAYAKALEAAGVPVRYREFPGMIHGFFDMGILSPAAAAAVDSICADLRELLV